MCFGIRYGDDIYNSGILTLHYSALLGKGTNKLIYNEGREPSANAQYNWWGTNSNPSTLVGAGLDYYDEPCDDVDVSNWVVMSVDPTSIEKVIVGNEKILTVNFNHYNANGVIKELAKSIPSINVNFEAVNGTLSSDVAATDNGVASVTYTVKGNDQITVKSGSQTLTVPVTTKELTNILTNETFFDYFINGTLADYVPEGATLDFRGKFYSHDDVKFDLAINKPINMISTTGDAFIDLNTTAGSLLGENPGSCFTINNGGSGSNVSGIIFHNTQVWIYDAHNVVLNNISVIVENKRVGSGVGTTTIRHGSTNVTLKNSYIYTSNNGGSSSIVLTHVQNCTVENLSLIHI